MRTADAAAARHTREELCVIHSCTRQFVVLAGFVPRDMSTGSAEAAGAVPMLKPSSVILACKRERERERKRGMISCQSERCTGGLW
jgi:hypothetical protein